MPQPVIQSPPESRRAPARDPWFDNAKMTLVTLVVVGHAWVLLEQSPLRDHLYDFLYAWHVPAFVFVTGYLSRSFNWERHRLWQLVRTVAVPYVVFECAIALFRIHVGGEEMDNLFRDPHWPMWYLAALFFWRLLTPVFVNLRGGLVLAVVISLAAGNWAGDTLDVARVLGLLPFFVMGLKATPERLELLRQRWVQVAGVVVLVAILLATRWTDEWASTEWFYYRSLYDEVADTTLEATLTRALVLVVGTLGAWAFFALVPRNAGWFTRMGAWTLVVYLFHGFAVKGAQYAGWEVVPFPGTASAIAITTVAAVGVALVLAWGPVARLLQHAVDPFASATRQLDRAVDATAARQEADQIAAAVQQATEPVGATVRRMHAEDPTPRRTPDLRP
ncbi:acyltransferase family protein [Nocardioides sp. zg-DK7169]|uniref:acyltransferase family protein n=1 Tax=Nocardioides sp. zg-DK7169 TaxID=2736600 RepID=UPI001555316E|nr:acyltransferase family protein [Nocardioides sp. zg-DK7169]